MPSILGSGEHRYRVVENWAKLPEGWNLTDVASVAVDSKDRIYVFNRGEHPMVVFDREGNFIKSWGEGLFNRAHGLHIDADDNLYCTDDGDHTVRKCTTDGKVLLTIGIPNKPAPFMSGEPFHRCTHTALSPKGEIYVSDGYGNACVHKYSPDGKLLKTWGEPGSDPGQFNIVHNIAADADGFVYVADRENRRLQMFTADGSFVKQLVKADVTFARDLAFSPDAAQQFLYVGGGKGIYIVDRMTLDILGMIQVPGQLGPGHHIATDSKGNIYIAQTAAGLQKLVFKGMK